MCKRFLLILVVIAVFGSCNSSKESSSKSSVDIAVNASMTAFGIYFTGADSVKIQSVRELIKRKLRDFQEITTVPDSLTADSYILERYNDLTGELAPPDAEYLSFAGEGLSEEEIQKLQHANGELIITFFSTRDSILEKQRSFTLLMGELVQGSGNFIGEFNTMRYYSAASWKEQRADKVREDNILQEIVMHTYREEEFCRIVTLGMGKFCLPDISIKDIPCSDQENFGALVNAVIATWITKPEINEDSTLLIDLQNIQHTKSREYLTSALYDGAEQKAEIRLTDVEPEEGDNPNTQFKIVFADPAFTTPREEQLALIKKLFGSKEEYVEITHDEEILEASKRAKSRLPELQALFNKGLEPGYSIFVKAPFKTDSGDNEWMWVEVTLWNDQTIDGILQNEPFKISNLKAGAQVTVNTADVFDYMLFKPDGTSEGNETGMIMDGGN